MARQSGVDKYIDAVGEKFLRLPKIPYDIKRAIVSFLPYVALICGIIGVASTVVALGIFTILEPLAQITGIKGTGQNFFFVLLSFASLILLLTSFSDLHRKRISGWKRIYLSLVIGILACIFNFNFLGSITYLVSFYILYQILNHYK